MNHRVPLLIGLLAVAATAYADPPILQPSQIIEAPADAGPISEQTYIGYRVSVDGNRMLLASANGLVYRKDAAGDWDHRATLVLPDEGYDFTHGVIRGDTAVISTVYAHLADLLGRVYVFQRAHGTWSLVQTIDEPFTGGLQDATLAFDGETIALGSAHADTAWVYTKNHAGTFVLTATLAEEPPPPPYRLNYGFSVAVEGKTLLVGAAGANDLNGGVYVYRNTGSTWQRTQLLTPNDPQRGSEFGRLLSLDHDLLLVGSPWADLDPTGNVPTLNGAAYVFAKHGAQWSQEEKISNPTNGSFAHEALALDGRRAIISAHYIRPHDDDPYGTPFAFARAFVYERNHGDWALSSVLEGFQSSNNFALDVAIKGRQAFAGDPTVQTPDPLFDGQMYEFDLPAH